MEKAFNHSMDLLLFIVNADKGQRVISFAAEQGVLGGTILLGEGTVKNTILRKLGLDNASKEIVLLLAPTDIAKKTIQYVSEVKELNKKNRGIAVRASINNVLGITDRLIHIDGEQQQTEGAEETMYQAIVTIVDQGQGRDVMDVAEKHGARGGTLIKARGAGSAEAQRVFNIEIEPEKDILLIITQVENTQEIAKGIGDYLNIDEENTGVLFTIDLSETRGLFE